jgi:hypothetical protein
MFTFVLLLGAGLAIRVVVDAADTLVQQAGALLQGCYPVLCSIAAE